MRLSKIQNRSGISLLLAALVCGCASQTAPSDYREDLSERLPAGKADLLDEMTPLALDDAALKGKLAEVGSAGDRHFYVLPLQFGDRFEIKMTTAKNTLRPDFTLFRGSSAESSVDFQVEGQELTRGVKTLTKEYVVSSPRRYVVVVRAYQGVGKGTYYLETKCLGGPCKGEYPDPQALDSDDAAECIAKAFECSLKQARSEGAVDATRSQEIFDGCMGKVSLTGGYGCNKACAFVDEKASYNKDAASATCKHIVSTVVPFLADKSAECASEFDQCYKTCGEYETSWDDQFDETPVSVCLGGGMNGNCNSYAVGHSDCGGSEYTEGSYEACCAFEESTFGAWADDMDTICNDACNY